MGRAGGEKGRAVQDSSSRILGNSNRQAGRCACQHLQTIHKGRAVKA